MSGRPTADIVAELTKNANWYDAGDDWLLDAARRLAELDTEVGTIRAALLGALGHVLAIDNLRPPCTTCGGKGPNRMDSTYHDEVFPSPCPDCVDGKVSIEQLAAMFTRIRDTAPTMFRALYDYLRAVKP